ncbi:MAG UNVERIFIED_CONTAM: hypothetical protein LVR18_00905 [Planctomycetaceae bacterium]|jgi:hypothetical protein
MSDSDREHDKTDSTRSLWCRLLNGIELTSEEQVVLREALGSDGALRSECHTDATLHALLRSLHDVKQSEDAFVQGVMGAVKQAATLPEVSVSAATKRDPLSVPGGGRRRRSSLGWLALTGTAMLFAAAGLVIWWSSAQHQSVISGLRVQTPVTQDNVGKAGNVDRTSLAKAVAGPAEKTSPRVSPDRNISNIRATDGVAAQPKPSGELSEQMDDPKAAQIAENKEGPTESTFVTLSKITDAIWERSWVEGDRIGNDVVRLFGGSLELQFDDGAKVKLEGPVEFRPMTSWQLELRRGRLLAAVPKEAIGFTVSTPTSQVVDLGPSLKSRLKRQGRLTLW